MTATVIIAAGGTGGHMFPAEALAAELERRGYTLALVTDRRGGGYGEALQRATRYEITAGQVAGRGLIGRLRGLLSLAMGVLQARRLIARLKPAAAVGFGGYAAFPATFAACQKGVPTVIHEQNAVLGRANRLLAGRARYIATAFEDIAGLSDGLKQKCILVGNPVRDAVAAIANRAYPNAEADGPINLLVTGGSQGAHIFSEVVPAAVALLSGPERARLRISQQVRAEDMDRARAAFAGVGLAPELASFFDDLPARLGQAHLVICRSGASTVAECGVAGRPAVLVPYPHATDDHQTANAQAVDSAGGGWLMPQDSFTGEALAQRIRALLENPARLRQAGEKIKALGHPNAAEKLADLVASLAPVGEAAA
ncbi:MAG: undecaprenyldiphospho-muramoylpentapeptide beta-N-acetylglucosaminyltransferase [Alphaproteobacteria bacterium]|nr:undecaprenyldiphospho-muramoylpentapeptide beta-N-acetylglucosaminyltransferase [Alphaproteobacteria bacterium]